jgi:predicted metal-dependent HD superfamily phosphohydrolase
LTHHIEPALKLLDESSASGNLKDSIEMALWFHDVIYDAKRADNEHQSALFAIVAMNDMGIKDMNFRHTVRALIGATKHSRRMPLGMPSKLICDIDLASLGSSRQQFEANGRLIRKEYAFANEKEWKLGRKLFAEMMLARAHIYSTPDFQKRFEVQARRNLQRMALGIE